MIMSPPFRPAALAAAGLLAAGLLLPVAVSHARVQDGEVVEEVMEAEVIKYAAPTGGKMIQAPVVTKAVCVLMPVGDGDVRGTITFERVDDSKVKVTGEITGLTPGEHGFHVHQFGDATDQATGKSMGGHMDVGDESPHGEPSDAKRHTGDLGNVTANEDGVAKVDMVDEVISLNGAHSILGRGIIVHADPDDFGQPTGNAGARVAMGVIGVAQDGIK